MSRRDDGFRCTVHPDHDRAAVRPVGEVDLATAGVVDASLRELLDSGFRELLVDLRDVTFMDSSGIRLLIAWTRRASDDGFRFAYVPGQEAVRQVLRMTGVDLFVPEAGEAPSDGARA